MNAPRGRDRRQATVRELLDRPRDAVGRRPRRLAHRQLDGAARGRASPGGSDDGPPGGDRTLPATSAARFLRDREPGGAQGVGRPERAAELVALRQVRPLLGQ